MGKFTFDNMPSLRILTNTQIEEIHVSATRILAEQGVVFKDISALKLLGAAGCIIDQENMIARIPNSLVEKRILTTPSNFDLYDREGNLYCKFADTRSHYNIGSCSASVLDRESRMSRSSNIKDFNTIIKVAQNLEVLDYVCTTVVIEESPLVLGEQYNYYAEIRNSTKPIIGGAVDPDGTPRTWELLKAVRGSEKEAAEKPYTVFDICIASPMTWSKIAVQNIMDCAKFGIPIEFISALISGITAPVSIAGAIVQHTVELLSGIVFAQVLRPGLPLVYGGAPCMFNMKTTYTPMSAIESDLITCGYALMGRYYGIPTHTYAASSDAKIIDYQAGSESTRTAFSAMLAGIDNISGPGSLNCMGEMSPEKVVIDAEMIAKLKHFEKGIRVDAETLAEEVITRVGPAGNFMMDSHTTRLFKTQHDYHNELMSYEDGARWERQGRIDLFDKAKEKVDCIMKMQDVSFNGNLEHRLNDAFIDICQDVKIAKEEAQRMIELCAENA